MTHSPILGWRILGLSKLARLVEHSCMNQRGIRAVGATTVTSAHDR
ncbi:MAG: hypothetical protein JO345_19890 [Streptosporangiaceae bacterium]|nr:hypothetical protein [Streptosporangiaceae bacterium]